VYFWLTLLNLLYQSSRLDTFAERSPAEPDAVSTDAGKS